MCAHGHITRSQGQFIGSTCGGPCFYPSSDYVQVLGVDRFGHSPKTDHFSGNERRMKLVDGPPDGLVQIIQHQDEVIGVGTGRAEHGTIWSRRAGQRTWDPVMTPSEGMPTESVTVFSGHLEQRPSLCMMWREDRVACLVNGAETGRCDPRAACQTPH